MNNLSKIIVTTLIVLLLILSIYAVLFIQLGIGFPIGYAANNEEVNAVCLNFAYSYLAGLIIYLLTSFLPKYLKEREIQRLFEKDIRYVCSISLSLVRCVLTPSTLNDRDNAEAIVDAFKSKSYYDVVELSPRGYKKQVIDCIIDCKQRVDEVLKGVLATSKDYLSVEQIDIISTIIDPSVLQELIQYKMNPSLDYPRRREDLANILFDQIGLIEKLRKMSL